MEVDDRVIVQYLLDIVYDYVEIIDDPLLTVKEKADAKLVLISTIAMFCKAYDINLSGDRILNV